MREGTKLTRELTEAGIQRLLLVAAPVVLSMPKKSIHQAIRSLSSNFNPWYQAWAQTGMNPHRGGSGPD